MLRSGDTIGGYTLIDKLGSGGFGAVWLAEKRSHFVTKKVAVKLPHDDQVNFDAIRQEATLWEQASGHPNVLPIIDADVYDGQVVIVSEYADGGSLADQLKEVGTTSLKYAVELTIGILNGLEFLHGRGIIHRDIKPANILLQGGTPRLADFGISRAIQTTAISSTIIGTDAYMAPEAFDGKRNIQTDIWSVGVVLYQLLKGTLPFPQEHPSERMFAVLTKEFAPLDDDVPASLRDVVEKALQKLPENRYATTGEMRDDLQQALVRIAHPGLVKTEVLKIQPADVPAEISAADDEVATVAAIQGATAVMKPNIAFEETVDEKETVVRAAGDLGESNGPPDDPEVPRSFLQGVTHDIKKEPLIYAVAGSILIVFVIGVIATMLPNGDGASGGPNTPSKRYLSSYDGEGGKKGYQDYDTKKIVVPAKYDEASSFSEDDGVGAVKLNDKWGLVDINGNEVVSPKYDNSPHFGDESEGISNAVSLNGKYGFIDKTGRTVIPFDFEGGQWFVGGLAPVKKGGKYGYIDKTGKEVIPFIFDAAQVFRDSGIAAVQKKGSGTGLNNRAIIDKTGKELTPYKYEYVDQSPKIDDTDDDRIMVRVTDKDFKSMSGYIDNRGNEVIPPRFESGDPFRNGKAKVKLASREFYIDKNGNETSAPPTDQ